MSDVVLDASVFIGACSPAEIHHGAARAMIDSLPVNRPFLVPSLFRVEVAAALARRRESAFFLDTVDALITGPRFHTCPLDDELVQRSVEVARLSGCRAYDAVYGALALSRGAALLTLDAELRRLLAAAYPGELRFSSATPPTV
jgi:predicted nucleic acid-binding protein